MSDRRWRARAFRCEAKSEQTLLGLGLFHEGVDLAVEAVDDRFRRAGRRDDRQPAIDAKAGQRFGHGRQVVKAGEALAGGDGDPAKLAGLHKPLNGRHGADHHRVYAGNRVLQNLRGGAIGHRDHLDPGALGQQLADHDLIAARRVDAIVQFSGIGFGVGDQLGQRFKRRVRIDGDDERAALGNHSDRREIADRIVGHRLEQKQIGRQRARQTEIERVPIGRCAGDSLPADHAGRAGNVFDHHRLTELARHAVAHQPRQHVGAQTGARGYHELYRPRRPVLRDGVACEHDRGNEADRQSEQLHCSPVCVRTGH
ncbi:MAG: hypothetical protein NTV56_14195 [Alphaproteobacteria bacterium]|nr:hypothetical protein [Alphaproteobacteria bacterium]